MIHPYVDNPEIVPSALRCVDGKVVLADGSDPQEYLKAWAEGNEYTGEEPLVLLTRSLLISLLKQARYGHV